MPIVTKPILPTCAKNPKTCRLLVPCGKGHPVNYRGCVIHRELQRSKNTKDVALTHDDVSKVPSTSAIYSQPDNNKQHTQQKNTKGKPLSNATSSRTYSDTVKSSNLSNPLKCKLIEPSLSTQFSSFIEHFQSLITPLINLLTTLVDKILIKNDL